MRPFSLLFLVLMLGFAACTWPPKPSAPPAPNPNQATQEQQNTLPGGPGVGTPSVPSVSVPRISTPRTGGLLVR
jgi:hypothetical protein